MRFVLPFVLVLLLLLQTAYAAPIVDASAAEAAFQKGDYKAAREGFDAALQQFLARAPRDATDHKVYAQAEYILDRLSDCSFTQRDWPRLKQYMDSQWRMVNQDIDVCNEQFRGAMNSPNQPVRSVAQFIANQMDEASRLRQIFQLKRSLALLLLDSNGTGPRADKAIHLYQQLALAMRKVISVEDGGLRMDIRKLTEEHIGEFEDINAQLPESEMQPLWDKYKPAPKADSSSKPPAAEPKAKPAKPGSKPPAK